MKNIRLFVSTLCLLTFGIFSTARGVDKELPAGLSVAIEIETKTITKEDAAALVASREKVTLDVYLILRGAGWKQFLADNNVVAGSSRYSYALFDNTTYTLGQYLPDPSDHILICCNSLFPKPASVPDNDVCRADVESDEEGFWYATPQWQLENGGGGLKLEWPTYAYSVGNNAVSTRIRTTGKYIIQDGDNLKIRLYSLQFILKDPNRDYPVGLVDENFANGLNGSHGASEVNLVSADALIRYVWPGYPNIPGTSNKGSDWTDCRGTNLFEFINGGLFIQTGPEVETFEPNYAA